MIDNLVQNSNKYAYLTAVASIASFVTISLFFALGGGFGPLNDAVSVFQFLFLVPVALAIFRILATYAPALSLGATAVGVGAMLLFAFLQTLLVFGVVRFEQTFQTILALGGVVAVWWIITSILTLVTQALPAGPAWVGVLAGMGFLMTLVGIQMGGWEHPLAAIGFLMGAVAMPVWAVWMGRVLGSAV